MHTNDAPEFREAIINLRQPPHAPVDRARGPVADRLTMYIAAVEDFLGAGRALGITRSVPPPPDDAGRAHAAALLAQLVGAHREATAAIQGMAVDLAEALVQLGEDPGDVLTTANQLGVGGGGFGAIVATWPAVKGRLQARALQLRGGKVIVDGGIQIGELIELLNVSPDTLRTYRADAGVAGPGPGQRNHLFTATEAAAIVERMRDHGKSADVRRKAAAALETLAKIRKKPA